MRIYLISGDHDGVGKTTFANRLVGDAYVCSLARAVRDELNTVFPGYPWFATDQRSKEETIVKETGLTIREMLVDWAEKKCKNDPLYYVRKLVNHLEAADQLAFGSCAIAIDDVRKVLERDFLKDRFRFCEHFHVVSASHEVLTGDTFRLSKTADYLVVRNSNDAR